MAGEDPPPAGDLRIYNLNPYLFLNPDAHRIPPHSFFFLSGYQQLSENTAEGIASSPASVSDLALESTPSSDSESDSDSEGWIPLGEEETSFDRLGNGYTSQHLSAWPEPGGAEVGGDDVHENGNSWQATFNNDESLHGLRPHITGNEALNSRGNIPLAELEGENEGGTATLAPGASPLQLNSDFDLSSEQLDAVKSLMTGISLEYRPPWAGEVPETQWRQRLQDRLEGRRREAVEEDPPGA